MRKPLEASEDTILTDGKHYGKIVYLADGKRQDDWFEISIEEYQKILEKGEEKYGINAN